MSYKIFAISKKIFKDVAHDQITPIGGLNSSGLALVDLRHKNDYAILTPVEDRIRIHFMRGKMSGTTHEIFDDVVLRVDDLILAVFKTNNHSAQEATRFNALSTLGGVLAEIDQTGPSGNSLDLILKEMTDRFSLDKGLIISKQVDQKFQICSSRGVSTDEPWLSERLIEKVIKEKKSVQIKNIFGSEFENSQSLQASQFLSVYAWPLRFQDESLGVILLGTSKPHSGLSRNEFEFAAVLVQIASLSLYFFLRSQHQEEAISRIQGEAAKCPLVSADRKLQEVCQLAEQIAVSDISVLIQGETGVGKELLAQWIHQQSGRKREAFVAINCGAIPGELLESILFGHAKGSFTGAHKDQVGKFQLANQGTVFLDEVGDLPESMQVKLLRVLQEQVIEPLGSPRPVPVDIRVIAATHRDLPRAVELGKFREDLYYRLAEMTFTIPPLRDRVTDIVVLAQHFLDQEKGEKNFSPGAWNYLKSQPWKGNVRELKSAVRRAAILTSSREIRAEDFTKGAVLSGPEEKREWLEGGSLDAARLHFTFQKVKQALEMSQGSRKDAAQMLGVTPRTLFRYLDELNRKGKNSAASPH